MASARLFLQHHLTGELVASLSESRLRRLVAQLESGREHLACFTDFLNSWPQISGGQKGPTDKNSESSPKRGGCDWRWDDGFPEIDQAAPLPQPNSSTQPARCVECVCGKCGKVMSGETGADSELSNEDGPSCRDSKRPQSTGSAVKEERVTVRLELQLVEARHLDPTETLAESQLGTSTEGFSGSGEERPREGQGLRAGLVLVTFCRGVGVVELEEKAKRVAELEEEVGKLKAHFQYTIDLHPDLIFTKDRQVGAGYKMMELRARHTVSPFPATFSLRWLTRLLCSAATLDIYPKMTEPRAGRYWPAAGCTFCNAGMAPGR
jgi:hypothetical protein